MTSLARSVISRIGRSLDVSAIAMIGESFGSKCRMTGSWMSCGNARRMPATFACTSCCATAMSTPRLNWSRTIDVPSDEVELISLTPWTVLSVSSIGLEISRIITSGEAPG